MNVKPLKTRIFKNNEPLFPFIKEHVKSLKDGSILLVTSKILALAQGLTVPMKSISKKDLVKKEADLVLCESYKTYLTIKDGILIPAAGIDESNAQDNYILWPRHCFEEAQKLWAEIRHHYAIKNVGVIFTDSRCTPLRKGVTGIAISYWGFKGIQNHIGKPDLFGRPLVMSTSNVADALSCAGVLLMGESDEACPLALITDYAADFTETVDPLEVRIPPEQDIFAPVLKLDGLPE